MARKLFTVEGVFSIQRRGTILIPGLVPERDGRFVIGKTLRLLRPDGTETQTAITGLDRFSPPLSAGPFAVMVALPKSEVPIGTEVWSL
jgi:hypothetical protein